jgi:hypothetical protein
MKNTTIEMAITPRLAPVFLSLSRSFIVNSFED